ncbi:DUF2189 domain-containing protein [Phaeovulum sp.]|uniref:DUF2189 domain-containing protein n=1 Tax=Phaeovulum sp. TaxID=2934796 RepID=UPI0035683162
MTQEIPEHPSPLPSIARLTVSDLGAALSAGLRDFLRAPAFGLLFSAFYVAGGIVLYLVAASTGQEWWLIPFVVGFPLLAPFAAVGLYEVSRRIEVGDSLIWRQVLGVVFAQKDRQIPSMAMVILLIFMFWVFVAHTIFALFMGLSAMTNITSSPAVLLQGNGPLMLLIGSAIGGAFALAVFSFTLCGLPLLLEREIDFITAIVFSVQSVLANKAVLALWAICIAALLALGMAPLFLGLFVVLPVLGHASWHLYRRITAE